MVQQLEDGEKKIWPKGRRFLLKKVRGLGPLRSGYGTGWSVAADVTCLMKPQNRQWMNMWHRVWTTVMSRYTVCPNNLIDTVWTEYSSTHYKHRTYRRSDTTPVAKERHWLPIGYMIQIQDPGTLSVASSLCGGSSRLGFKNVRNFNVTWALGTKTIWGTNAYLQEYLNWKWWHLHPIWSIYTHSFTV